MLGIAVLAAENFRFMLLSGTMGSDMGDPTRQTAEGPADTADLLSFCQRRIEQLPYGVGHVFLATGPFCEGSGEALLTNCTESQLLADNHSLLTAYMLTYEDLRSDKIKKDARYVNLNVVKKNGTANDPLGTPAIQLNHSHVWATSIASLPQNNEGFDYETDTAAIKARLDQVNFSIGTDHLMILTDIMNTAQIQDIHTKLLSINVDFFFVRRSHTIFIHDNEVPQVYGMGEERKHLITGHHSNDMLATTPLVFDDDYSIAVRELDDFGVPHGLAPRVNRTVGNMLTPWAQVLREQAEARYEQTAGQVLGYSKHTYTTENQQLPGSSFYLQNKGVFETMVRNASDGTIYLLSRSDANRHLTRGRQTNGSAANLLPWNTSFSSFTLANRTKFDELISCFNATLDEEMVFDSTALPLNKSLPIKVVVLDKYAQLIQQPNAKCQLVSSGVSAEKYNAAKAFEVQMEYVHTRMHTRGVFVSFWEGDYQEVGFHTMFGLCAAFFMVGYILLVYFFVLHRCSIPLEAQVKERKKAARYEPVGALGMAKSGKATNTLEE